MDEILTSETRSTARSDDISEHFNPLQLPKRGTGPLAVRGLLKTAEGKVIPEPHLGRLLGYYRGGQPYGRGTISTWEAPERGARRVAKYAMSEQALYCYQRLLADLVQATTGGRFELVAQMGKRGWHFKLVGRCRQCGRKFQPRRRTDVHCARHSGKGKR